MITNRLMPTDWTMSALLVLGAPMLLGALHGSADAAVVALDVTMPLDRVAPGRPELAVGDLHRARIFYDDAAIDPKKHIVRVLHMEHWMGRWAPQLACDPTLPMADAWLDLTREPYRYRYRGIAFIGEPIRVEFDVHTRRMSIFKPSDGSVIASAPYAISPTPVRGAGLTAVAPRAVTMLNMTVTLDQVAPGQPGKTGDVDHLRVVYDANAVDPVTKRVRLLNLQHYTGGRYMPPAPDPVSMPTENSWLDLAAAPYRLHYRASVVHGRPIVIDFDERLHRLTIHPQDDPAATLISGPYAIDPTGIVGPEAIAAGSPPRSAPASTTCASAQPTPEAALTPDS
jgi:hypothetical protein